MKIPDPLRVKIIRVFGDKGVEWLCHASELASKMITHWELTQVSLSPVLSHNLVYFAFSPTYGNVALKIGVPHDELFREMEALRAYDGHLACAMHDCDPKSAAMLLERIMPGSDLWQLKKRDDRVRVAGYLLRALPVAAGSISSIPFHRDVVHRTFQRIASRAALTVEMPELIRTAIQAEELLYADEVPLDLLLHGDLNHWNILCNGADEWRVIDPQGFVGPAVLDAGRFVLNEMTYADSPCGEAELPKLIADLAISSGLNIPNIWRSALIDAVLSACWHIEDDTSAEKMIKRMQVCSYIMRAGTGIF